jgi:hypothetical protein
VPDKPSTLPQFAIELSDADQTLKARALGAGVEGAAGAAGSADATGELTEADILEEDHEEAGLDDIDVIVEAEPPPRSLPPPPSLPSRSLPRPLPPPPIPVRARSSMSFAPVALDLAPFSRPRADSTVLVPRVRSARERHLAALVAAAATFAIVGLGSLVATMTFSSRPIVTRAWSPRVAALKEKEIFARTSALAISAPDLHAPATVRATIQAPRVVTVASPNASAASGAKTGVLRVPPSVHGMLVDGRPQRVDGTAVLPCGPHTVKTGIGPARSVDVPCGGTASM